VGGVRVDDDCELDDWEDQAFEEDVYDHSELDLLDEDVDDHNELDQFDGGGVATAAPVARTDIGGERMGWSAWDVGTVFALGGWLADRHAEQTAQQVAEALKKHNTGRTASGSPLGASHPPPASGYPYREAPASLKVENRADPVALFIELSMANLNGQDLMFQLEGPEDLDRPLVLIISAVPMSSGPRFWVVAEAHTGGFSPARLIPVFQRTSDSAVAIFASDYPDEAVDAAVWACGREGVPLEEFHVTHRQPPRR
jgi:hypothetical protein